MKYLPYITTFLAYLFLTLAALKSTAPAIAIVVGFILTSIWFAFYLYKTNGDFNNH